MNSRKKIFLADDETINLDFFELMLSKLGYVVEKTNDGNEVIEKVRNFLPDLILLDNIMPGITGWEITKILKSDPKCKQIPIIMVSALDDVKEKVASFEAGVDDYITKPYNFSEVLARIKAVLRNHELVDQIAVRETRLVLAEELYKDLKENLNAFIESIDELDKETAKIMDTVSSSKDELNHQALVNLIKPIDEKILAVRRHITALDARIEKTTNVWDNLKKDEIGLPVLETKIREFLHHQQ